MTNIKIEALTNDQLNSLINEVKADRMKFIASDRIKYNMLINFGFELEKETQHRAENVKSYSLEISSNYGILINTKI